MLFRDFSYFNYPYNRNLGNIRTFVKTTSYETHSYFYRMYAALPLRSAESQRKVIDRPPFCVRNTTSIEVSKVVLSDTATVLHIYAKYHPKFWIKIASSSYLKDNNGETYPLRSGIGITPDREFWMPESGEAEFQLVFPPLLANATSIDFSEGSEVEQGFSIWGIQLKARNCPNLNCPKGQPYIR